MTVALEGDEKSHHCGSSIAIVGAVRLRVFTDSAWRAWNFRTWENFNGHEDGGTRPRTNAILRDFSSFPPLMSTGPSPSLALRAQKRRRGWTVIPRLRFGLRSDKRERSSRWTAQRAE